VLVGTDPGSGAVNVSSGGHLVSGTGDAALTGNQRVDHAGIVTVTGVSSWQNHGLLEVFGGTINIGAGSGFENSTGNVNVDGAGHVNVDGVGSKWMTNVSTLNILSGTLTVSNGGTVAGNVAIGANGTLNGDGTINSPGFMGFTNGGTVAPGNPHGALQFTSGYTQSAAGKLKIDIGGTSPMLGFDRLVVNG